MSLDIYLKSSEPTKKNCHHCGSDYEEYETLFDTNITHNLGKMAKAAGIYEALWRPEENGWTKPMDIYDVVHVGYLKLVADPDHFKQFNALNGWGLYEHFVNFVEEYLNALKEYPDSIINVSR